MLKIQQNVKKDSAIILLLFAGLIAAIIATGLFAPDTDKLIDYITFAAPCVAGICALAGLFVRIYSVNNNQHIDALFYILSFACLLVAFIAYGIQNFEIAKETKFPAEHLLSVYLAILCVVVAWGTLHGFRSQSGTGKAIRIIFIVLLSSFTLFYTLKVNQLSDKLPIQTSSPLKQSAEKVD